MMVWKKAIALLALVCFQNVTHADVYVDQAKKFFGSYVKLGNNFNPDVANFYLDSAIIRNRRIYPNGNNRVFTFTGKQYKALIRQVMPLAKIRGDKNSYSQVKYKRVGNKMKIDANRYSLLKKYTSPITIILTMDSKKKWSIAEEYSKSRP